MFGGRRPSLAGSVMSEFSGIGPRLTEEEVAGLSIEQLELGAEDLRRSCGLLKEELDLYTRFLTQAQQEGSDDHSPDNTPTKQLSFGSGSGTPTVSSLEMRALWQGRGVVTRQAATPSDRLSERDKLRLWRRETQLVRTKRRQNQLLWNTRLHALKVSRRAYGLQARDLTNLLTKLEGYLPGNLRQFKRESLKDKLDKGRKHRQESPRRLTFEHVKRLLESIVESRRAELAKEGREAARLKNNINKIRHLVDNVDNEGGIGEPTEVFLQHRSVLCEQQRTFLSALRDKVKHQRQDLRLCRDDTQSSEHRIEELKAEVTSLEKEKKSLKLEKDRLSQALARGRSLFKACKEGTLQQTKELQASNMTVLEYLDLRASMPQLQRRVAQRARRRLLSAPSDGRTPETPVDETISTH